MALLYLVNSCLERVNKNYNILVPAETPLDFCLSTMGKMFWDYNWLRLDFFIAQLLAGYLGFNRGLSHDKKNKEDIPYNALIGAAFGYTAIDLIKILTIKTIIITRLVSAWKSKSLVVFWFVKYIGSGL